MTTPKIHLACNTTKGTEREIEFIRDRDSMSDVKRQAYIMAQYLLDNCSGAYIRELRSKLNHLSNEGIPGYVHPPDRIIAKKDGSIFNVWDQNT